MCWELLKLPSIVLWAFLVAFSVVWVSVFEQNLEEIEACGDLVWDFIDGLTQ